MAPLDIDTMDLENEQQNEKIEKIQVKFIQAKGCSHDSSLKVPSDIIAIPSDTRKKGLSAIVNHLLGRKVIRDNDTNNHDSENEEDEDDDMLPSIPFDFLINDKLLRMSVEAMARREGLSLEQAVTIYYFPARNAPSDDGQSESLPDWITSMTYDKVSKQHHNHQHGILATGAADGSIHIFQHHYNHSTTNTTTSEDDSFVLKSTLKAHSGPIKCVASKHGWYNTTHDHTQGLIASGSMDQTLLTHVYDYQYNKSSDDDYNLTLHAVYSGGHTSSISAIAIHSVPHSSSSSSSSSFSPLKTFMTSGDWNGNLCVWTIPSTTDSHSLQSNNGTNYDDDTESTGQRKLKKKKITSTNNVPNTDTTKTSVQEVTPTITFKGHTNNISGISYAQTEAATTNGNTNHYDDARIIITASWDHSIKSWDLESQNCILTLNGSKVISCLDKCHNNSNVVATGHPDCAVRLWDMRVSKGGAGNADEVNVFDGTLRPSHKSWISGVQWSPSDPYCLASSSHDGTIKVWDIRSSLPLHTVRAHDKESKGLCLAFTESYIFSGGSDCVVKKFKYG
jgi:ribosome biogenesis protein YTM1